MVTKRSLRLFHQAANRVPAYGDFLKKDGLEPQDIKTARDYKRVPLTSKKNYLEKYPLPDLMWDGTLNKPLILSATSGSTGVPYYFLRDEKLSWQYSWLIEDFLKRGQTKNKEPVLVIIGFGMGIWIGGVITLRALEIATQRMNYPASLLPVGYNKNEIMNALKRLSPNFGQTILIGYPPFVKEVLDSAAQQNIDLKKHNTRLLFAAESFTETFRDYLCQNTGADPLVDTLCIYGTADIGAMAYETPISILIRRLAVKNKKLFRDIFGQIDKTPTLAQFNPRFIEFEELNGEILLSGNAAMPLIRYAVGDHGGVIGADRMRRIFKENGLDLDEEIHKADLSHIQPNHPFVFVYERVNSAASLQGITIYPEYTKEALLSSQLTPYFTGKFTMVTKYDREQNQYLEINIESKENIKLDTKTKSLTKKIIRQILTERSTEFAEISKTRNSQKLLKLIFWPQGHPRYFEAGVKQKWVVQAK